MKITSNSNNFIALSSNKTTKEYDFWKDPKSGLSFLDDKANKILNNILNDKNPQEMFLIKATMMINIQHPISIDKNGDVLRGNIKNFDNSENSVKIRIEDYNKYLKNALKGLPDKLGLIKITQKLLTQYTKEAIPKQIQSTEEAKSKNLEQFYAKNVQQPAEKIKVSLSSKDEILKTKNTPLKDAFEATK